MTAGAIVYVHCAACTGQARRRVVAEVVDDPDGPLARWRPRRLPTHFRRDTDDVKWSNQLQEIILVENTAGIEPAHCRDHGTVDFGMTFDEGRNQRAVLAAVARYRETHRRQHVAITPVIALRYA